MAYPDGTSVIRYYPVELTEITAQPANIGLGLWLKESPDGADYTVVSLDGEDISWTRDTPFSTGWVGALQIPTAAPGGFSERAFLLLDQQGGLVPITSDMLPLELYLSRSDYTYPGGYAGGIVQVGLYQGGEFVALASFQVKGVFFQDAFVPPGAWELLPEINPASVIEGESPMVLLNGNVPRAVFWTQLSRSFETDSTPANPGPEPEPEPEPEPGGEHPVFGFGPFAATLVPEREEPDSSWFGYSDGFSGSLTPSVFEIGDSKRVRLTVLTLLKFEGEYTFSLSVTYAMPPDTTLTEATMVLPGARTLTVPFDTASGGRNGQLAIPDDPSLFPEGVPVDLELYFKPT